MIKALFLMMAMVISVTGCKSETITIEDDDIQVMPNEMPKDFNFSLQFGFYKRNEINTFEGTVTKDLIEDGTTTIKLSLTTEEMKDIYTKMKEINITGSKELIPDTNCMQQPHEEDEWEIRINHETINHYISGSYCKTTNDAKEFYKLRNYIHRVVRSKEEYKNLPKAQGGYE
ncbi:hypothetical protein ACFSTA_17315 [Ornithinibacillus salinisoli]|uniref:Lipoprotein n=1 Tax=Ornithinibacillus salinisoli TaxID=1848459 RepID=A0ABW4W346_9BACI